MLKTVYTNEEGAVREIWNSQKQVPQYEVVVRNQVVATAATKAQGIAILESYKRG